MSFPSTTNDWERRVFDLFLVTSFLIHLLIAAVLMVANVRLHKEEIKGLEVVYHSASKPKEEAKKTVQPVQSLKTEKKRPLPEVLAKKTAADSPVLKPFDQSLQKTALPTEKPSPAVALDGKRHVTVPLLDSEKISNPRYLNYHDRIRSKIRDRAYFYIDDPRFQNGEVYLTFVVLADGSLKAVQIINEKTKANEYLRTVGLRSINESSPFPPFPADLKYPELSFNIVISFKVDK